MVDLFIAKTLLAKVDLKDKLLLTTVLVFLVKDGFSESVLELLDLTEIVNNLLESVKVFCLEGFFVF